tara:strand:+ start:47 stop:379 length:333 start_codon:yes stop_codon:yes gene_type:complete
VKRIERGDLMVKRNKKFQSLLEKWVDKEYSARHAHKNYLEYKEKNNFDHEITYRSFINAFYQVKKSKKPKVLVPPFLLQRKRPFDPKPAEHYDIDFKIFGITVFTKKIRT